MVSAPLKAVTYFLLAAVAFSLSLGWDLPTAARSQEREQAVTVMRVMDGDTVEISPTVGGKEDVRLIGVDTPETVDPNEDVQPAAGQPLHHAGAGAGEEEAEQFAHRKGHGYGGYG